MIQEGFNWTTVRTHLEHRGTPCCGLLIWRTNKNRWKERKSWTILRTPTCRCVCVMDGICSKLLAFTIAALNYVTIRVWMMGKKLRLIHCKSGTNSTNLISILTLHGQIQDLDVEPRHLTYWQMFINYLLAGILDGSFTALYIKFVSL